MAWLRLLFLFVTVFAFSKPISAEKLDSRITLPMDQSYWLFKGDKFDCRLIYTDTMLGEFFFHSEVLNDIKFLAKPKLDHDKQQAELMAVKAPWFGTRESLSIGSLKSNNHIKKLSFNINKDDLLGIVNQGYWLELVLYKNNKITSVVIPIVRFKEDFTAFEECHSSLPILTFSQARDSIFQFSSNQTSLSQLQMKKLYDIKKYIDKDERVTKVLIDGHADDIGSSVSSILVSRKRAELIATKLIQLGIDERRLEIRAHGARFPMINHDSLIKINKNHRVTLRLVRDSEKVVPNT
ncbi:OmpA family protein [Vibrio metschnikovii]|uniref:OmpA family protein n=1 Tax=Vibrio metschnikovii TaxID=28172 RepID=UPI002FC7BD58